MKQLNCLLIICTLGIMSCTNSQQKTSDNSTKETQKLESLLHTYYEDQLKLFPMAATALGDNRYNDLYPNSISQAYLKELKQFYTGYKSKLQSYNREALSENDKMNYDVENIKKT